MNNNILTFKRLRKLPSIKMPLYLFLKKTFWDSGTVSETELIGYIDYLSFAFGH
jgi:hypothetical protein